MKRLDEALAAYDNALAVATTYVNAWVGRGKILRERKRFDDAIHAYGKALAIQPNLFDALIDRGHALHALKRFDEALECCEKALALQPRSAEAHYGRGIVLFELQRWDLALASYEKAVAFDGAHGYAFSRLAECALMLSDWSRRDTLRDEMRQWVIEQKSVVTPFVLLGYLSDDSLQLTCARTFLQDRLVEPLKPLSAGAVRRNDKIKIAYLSPDFRNHAVAYLTAELFELHDRNRFDVIGVSFGPDGRSEMRARLVKAFDQFHDVVSAGDHDVAKLLNDLHVDIAVDLSGHTKESRPGILAHRPAPIQASYLGFAATMGADFIDYIIADPTVLPFAKQRYFMEKIVHLPECFLVNDRQRPIATQTPARAEAGLPADGFVFCCFNNSWKITPEVFEIWMRLLRTVEGSVLWLSGAQGIAMRNLRREAEARGVDGARLVFANHLERMEDHLARHRLADLFLDTLPYNAHTTASDALWTRLPVLTFQGETFAGRVAASLLNAIGLPELITKSLEDYEALALKLARNPVLLAEVKAKLARNRDTHPLFDTERFTRHIEAAYTTMWEISQRGEAPKSFAVEPIRA